MGHRAPRSVRRAGISRRCRTWLASNPSDHAQARDICLNYCEAREWCQRLLTAHLASVHGGGTRGTWAGQFFGKRGTKTKGTCPKCGVSEGHACQSPAGKKLSEPHRARVVGLPKCRACGTEFMPDRANIRYCSPTCQEEGKRIRHRRHDLKRPTVMSGDRTRGAA